MSAIYIAGIAMCSVFAQWMAWFFKVPAILFLLLVGLILGPITGQLDPDMLLGDLLFPVVSLAVAVILFEGSLTLHFQELKGIGKVVRNLCSIGMFSTFVLIGLSAYGILGLDWRVAAVLGAVLVVTDQLLSRRCSTPCGLIKILTECFAGKALLSILSGRFLRFLCSKP